MDSKKWEFSQESLLGLSQKTQRSNVSVWVIFLLCFALIWYYNEKQNWSVEWWEEDLSVGDNPGAPVVEVQSD